MAENNSENSTDLNTPQTEVPDATSLNQGNPINSNTNDAPVGGDANSNPGINQQPYNTTSNYQQGSFNQYSQGMNSNMQGQQNYNSFNNGGMSGQQGYNTYGGMGQNYNSYGANTYGQQSYDPYGGMYGQQGYDPYGGMSGMYGQQSYDPYGGMGGMYGQQGYDPYGDMSGMYGQQGYDPYGGMGGMYGQQSYDPYNQNSSSTTSNPTRVNVTPSNPMRVNMSPHNPSTSSNNVTLNLENLDKNQSDKNTENELIIKNNFLKLFLIVLMENNIEIELYSNQNDEIPIALGRLNMVTNQTISVENKVSAIKYVSYIKFSNKYITDNKIHEFFARSNTPRQKSFEYNIISDFYNLLYSKILLNQPVNVTIDSSFFTEIKNVTVVNLNIGVAILKSDDFYYLIEFDKIVCIE